MRGKKEGPAALTAKGRTIKTAVLYHIAPRLSMAAEIILLAQTPDPADGLRRACFARLERVLQRHYTERRAGI